MPGEYCGPQCGFCGRCDVAYDGWICATPHCGQLVKYPDDTVFCEECQSAVERRIAQVVIATQQDEDEECPI